MQDLLSADGGAISVQNTPAPFAFKNAQNVQQGVLRTSGVGLQEDGTAAGMVGRVDWVA
ncbi:hypothetical protein [Azohydromonas caseinilytica]|uniref:Uncharacterized protein n=1 Tax=Azohydromonas caseinilytica TaxID=2728836 RepID=A0A848F7R5_9BURK|nr:hypothetical protein [Azohydromonas caseinilytica]NML15218.1 hypothetical protein [Azohydromonas caseinilytica]